MKSTTLTWLHISDFHVGNPKYGYDARNKFTDLIKDLTDLLQKFDLRPNLIFFSGDLIFGKHPNAKPLNQQYLEFNKLIEKIRRVYSPVIQKEAIFFVPGNHDVDRTMIGEDQTQWLLDCDNSGIISEMIDKENVQFDRYQERLDGYRKFLDDYHYRHCRQNKNKLFYTQVIKVGHLNVAITGLDTAWSTSGDNDKGVLWLGQSQIDDAIYKSQDADVKIIIAHHPINWLCEHEERKTWRKIEQNFDYFLHGHEHNDDVTRINNCIKISGGCGYDSPGKKSGYNIIRNILKDCKADIFLRTHDSTGGGWIPKIISSRSSSLGIIQELNLPFAMAKFSAPLPKASSRPAIKSQRTIPVGARKKIDIFKYFTVAKAQDDEKLFVGRGKEIEIGIGALMAEGASIAIFGKAGVGKSSLALQLGYIAIGKHTKLIKKNRTPAKGFRNPVVYYCCRADTDTDLENIFLSILIDRSLPFSLGNLLSKENVQTELTKIENEYTFQQLKKINRYGRNDETLKISIQVFLNLASIISTVFKGNPFILIIDEYDVVKNKVGLAGIIKSQIAIKFIISGTAIDARLLVQDHASIPRQIAEGKIELKPMSKEECKLILKKEANKSRGLFAFTPEALDTLSNVAYGMPFFIHFFGRYSLDAALERTKGEYVTPLLIEKQDVHTSINKSIMKLTSLDAIYFELAVSDWKKEVLLNIMAHQVSDLIDIYEIASIAKLVGIVPQTCTKFANLLVKKDIFIKNDRNLYEFKENRLKVFIMLRKKTITAKAQKNLKHLIDMKHVIPETVERYTTDGYPLF